MIFERWRIPDQEIQAVVALSSFEVSVTIWSTLACNIEHTHVVDELGLVPQELLERAKAELDRHVLVSAQGARTIMRHPDLVDKEATKDLMQEAGERLLLEALDEMEVVFYDTRYDKTDCNHVFINFLPVVEMDPLAFAKELLDQGFLEASVP